MQPDASFELNQIIICPDLGRSPRDIRLEVSSVEQCSLAIFAKPNIHIDHIFGSGLLGGF